MGVTTNQIEEPGDYLSGHLFSGGTFLLHASLPIVWQPLLVVRPRGGVCRHVGLQVERAFCEAEYLDIKLFGRSVE